MLGEFDRAVLAILTTWEDLIACLCSIKSITAHSWHDLSHERLTLHSKGTTSSRWRYIVTCRHLELEGSFVGQVSHIDKVRGRPRGTLVLISIIDWGTSSIWEDWLLHGLAVISLFLAKYGLAFVRTRDPFMLIIYSHQLCHTLFLGRFIYEG